MKRINEEMNEFEIAFKWMAIIIPSLLVGSLLFGALFLPKEHISHDMNTFSILKFLLIEDESRFEPIIINSVAILLSVSIILSFVGAYRKNKLEKED